jgi:hypothetical protein
MTTRTTRQSVMFRRPFSISGAEGVQPAGTYIVETDEELLEGLSFPAYHRVSTSIILPVQGSGSGSYQVVRIDPAELEEVQRRDAEGSMPAAHST